jgi:hypothetical protein
MINPNNNHFSVEDKAMIVRMKTEGISNRSIAKELGRSHGAVNKQLSENKLIRSLIEKEATRIIKKGLRPSGDLILKLVGDAVVSSDRDEKRLGFDAAKHITNIAGISGSAPGTVVNTMIQVNQTNQVEELGNIQKFLAHQWGIKEEVIDAEVEEK